MDQLLLRQLKDVQVQAQKLLSQHDENQDLKHFSDYCSELKRYILKNYESKDVRKLADEVPDIFHVVVKPYPAPLIFLIILGIISVGISVAIYRRASQFERQRQIENNIHKAKGKFASIEFLLKAEA